MQILHARCASLGFYLCDLLRLDPVRLTVMPSICKPNMPYYMVSASSTERRRLSGHLHVRVAGIFLAELHGVLRTDYPTGVSRPNYLTDTSFVQAYQVQLGDKNTGQVAGIAHKKGNHDLISQALKHSSQRSRFKQKWHKTHRMAKKGVRAAYAANKPHGFVASWAIRGGSQRAFDGLRHLGLRRYLPGHNKCAKSKKNLVTQATGVFPVIYTEGGARTSVQAVMKGQVDAFFRRHPRYAMDAAKLADGKEGEAALIDRYKVQYKVSLDARKMSSRPMRHHTEVMGNLLPLEPGMELYWQTPRAIATICVFDGKDDHANLDINVRALAEEIEQLEEHGFVHELVYIDWSGGSPRCIRKMIPVSFPPDCVPSSCLPCLLPRQL